MKKLDDSFVDWQLKEWAKDDYPLTSEQVNTAKRLYNRLMNEEFNINKDLLTQEALLAEIARKLSYGETEDSTFRQHSDNRHMYMYDMYLEMGESDNILEVFEKFKIPTSVLKGVKLNIPTQVTTDIGDGNSVYIDSYIKPSPDDNDTSKLDIYLNGKRIYSYTSNIDSWDYVNFDNIQDEPEQETIEIIQVNKNGNERKSKLLKKIVTPEGKIEVEEFTNSAGKKQIAYRGKNGRFIKKPKQTKRDKQGRYIKI